MFPVNMDVVAQRTTTYPAHFIWTNVLWRLIKCLNCFRKEEHLFNLQEYYLSYVAIYMLSVVNKFEKHVLGDLT